MAQTVHVSDFTTEHPLHFSTPKNVPSGMIFSPPTILLVSWTRRTSATRTGPKNSSQLHCFSMSRHDWMATSEQKHTYSQHERKLVIPHTYTGNLFTRTYTHTIPTQHFQVAPNKHPCTSSCFQLILILITSNTPHGTPTVIQWTPPPARTSSRQSTDTILFSCPKAADSCANARSSASASPNAGTSTQSSTIKKLI